MDSLRRRGKISSRAATVSLKSENPPSIFFVAQELEGRGILVMDCFCFNCELDLKGVSKFLNIGGCFVLLFPFLLFRVMWADSFN